MFSIFLNLMTSQKKNKENFCSKNCKTLNFIWYSAFGESFVFIAVVVSKIEGGSLWPPQDLQDPDIARRVKMGQLLNSLSILTINTLPSPYFYCYFRFIISRRVLGIWVEPCWDMITTLRVLIFAGTNFREKILWTFREN